MPPQYGISMYAKDLFKDVSFPDEKCSLSTGETPSSPPTSTRTMIPSAPPVAYLQQNSTLWYQHPESRPEPVSMTKRESIMSLHYGETEIFSPPPPEYTLEIVITNQSIETEETLVESTSPSPKISLILLHYLLIDMITSVCAFVWIFAMCIISPLMMVFPPIGLFMVIGAGHSFHLIATFDITSSRMLGLCATMRPPRLPETTKQTTTLPWSRAYQVAFSPSTKRIIAYYLLHGNFLIAMIRLLVTAFVVAFAVPYLLFTWDVAAVTKWTIWLAKLKRSKIERYLAVEAVTPTGHPGKSIQSV